MGVHDNASTKYNVMVNSSIAKHASKRPYESHFGSIPTKQAKREEVHTNQSVDDKKKMSIQQQRMALPVYKHRKKLLEEIRKYPTLIIIGETGSGKTTQIPQLLFGAGMAGTSGCIGISNPRRVAAISIARRVAEEQNDTVGQRVGYCVRFENMTSPKTRIKYLTDGMMVREAMMDEHLSSYSIVILDEAHERSIQTDVLLGITKRAQKLRKLKNLQPLKIVVMSATMDVDKFTKYFEASAVYLEGRQHHVQIFHSKQHEDDYTFSALATAFQIHRNSPPNEDILIFLTGQEEIEAAVAAARKAAKLLDGKEFPHLKVFPLYSAIPTQQQLEAFKPSPPGMRKLVLSTNIAETSVTIGGIRTIIDTGVVKARTHNPITGMDVLRVEKISKAQAWQRTGRSGREAPGKCYRILTRKEFDELSDVAIPEMKRCSLLSVALQLLAIGIDITTFDFMDKPPKESIDAAIASLERLGAVKGSPPQLTTLGRTMSLFPLDPRFTKVILSSVEHQCLEEALSVVALLSGESVFIENPVKRQQALTARSKFISNEGDHVMLLNVYRAFANVKEKKSWCHDNFLDHKKLEYSSEIRKQLEKIAVRANLEKQSCGSDTKRLRKALLDGLFENLAELQRDGSYVTLFSRQPVSFHPTSALFGKKPELVLYTEVIATGRCYLRNLSVIESSWLSEKQKPQSKPDEKQQ